MAANILRHFQCLFCNCSIVFDETSKEGQYSTSSNNNKVVFCWLIPEQRWPSWPLIGWYRIAVSPATAEWFDGTWYGVSSQRHIPISCLPGPSIKIDGFTGSDWLRHFSNSPLLGLNGVKTKMNRKQVRYVLYQVCVFSGWSIIKRHYRLFSSIANGLWWKLQMKQVYATSSTKCVFRSGLHVSLKKSILTSDWLTHFYFSSVTAERILTK